MLKSSRFSGSLVFYFFEMHLPYTCILPHFFLQTDIQGIPLTCSHLVLRADMFSSEFCANLQHFQCKVILFCAFLTICADLEVHSLSVWLLIGLDRFALHSWVICNGVSGGSSLWSFSWAAWVLFTVPQRTCASVCTCICFFWFLCDVFTFFSEQQRWIDFVLIEHLEDGDAFPLPVIPESSLVGLLKRHDDDAVQIACGHCTDLRSFP